MLYVIVGIGVVVVAAGMVWGVLLYKERRA